MFVLACFVALACGVGCLGESGNSVDWWVAMKVPGALSYYYADTNSGGGLEESSGSLDGSGAIYNSVKQMYTASSSYGRLMWNDENPNGTTSESVAHSKGLLLFDGASGMYIIHSVPKYPPPNSYAYPSSGKTYGQSFLCMSLGSDVNSVLSSLIVTHPGLYVASASQTLINTYPALYNVLNGNWAVQPLGTSYAIQTRGSVSFTLFAKNKQWDRYLYEQLVAPNLNSDLIVETWTNGGEDNTDPTFCKNASIHYNIYNAMHIQFGSDKWARSKDHSKWAVGVHNSWFCIGGINRQVSQNLRGGGTCCSAELQNIHDALYAAVVDVNPCGTSAITPVGSRPPVFRMKSKK